MTTYSKLLVGMFLLYSGQQALPQPPEVGVAREDIADCSRILLTGLGQTEEGVAFLTAIESKLGKDWLNRFPYLDVTQLEHQREHFTQNIDYILPEDLKALHSPVAWGCDGKGRPFIAIVYNKTQDVKDYVEVFYQLNPGSEILRPGSRHPLWKGWVAIGYGSEVRDLGVLSHMDTRHFQYLAQLITDGTVEVTRAGGTVRLSLAHYS
jgi:hypothetical protein